MLEYIVRGAASAVLPMNLLVMFIGLVVGIVGGMLPGITTVTAVALFVPFTFSMPPDMALIGLGGVFCGAMYGGANAAILINTPGTPGSIATSLDGYPLVMQGRAEEACYIALIASVLGGIFGTVVLMLFFEPLSVMALKFGSEAFFWMGLFGLSTLAAMFPGNIAKGLLGGAIGLALCTVGLDPVMGMPRFTFGCFDLVQGLDMVALMIGLFSLSQMFVMLESDEKYIVKMERQAHAFKLAVTDILRHLKLLSVASAIGTFIGALPGAGGSVAALVSYNEAKRWDKDPSRYGKGSLEGVAASESANNAVIGGSLIPMLTLGIPGSAVAAVILGALMAHGIQPGFKIFTASGDLAYTFIMSQFAVNLLMIPVGFVLCQCMARLLSIRLTLVAIGIVVLAFIGAYAISNSLVDIWVVLAFGLVGFFGGKVGMDTGAMALGVILGPMIEENLGKSVDLSRSVDGGLMSVMFEGSINKVLIAALLLSLLTPFLLKLRNRKHAALLPEGPRPGWKTDLFAGIGFLAIAAAFLVQYEGLEGVSRVFPEVLTKLIGAGGAYFVGKGLWRRSREAAEPEGGEAVAWCKIGIICATSLCYAVLIPVFGFLVTTMGFIAGSTLILGDHSRGLPRLARTAIAFAIGFSLLVWAGFTLLLNVPVPEGMFL